MPAEVPFAADCDGCGLPGGKGGRGIAGGGEGSEFCDVLLRMFDAAESDRL